MPSDNELQVLWQHFGNNVQSPEAGNAGPFTGLVFAGYWNAEANWSTYLGNDGSWYDLGLPHGAWAVRTGDVAAVPIPGAIWLFFSAIAGITLAGRRKIS